MAETGGTAMAQNAVEEAQGAYPLLPPSARTDYQQQQQRLLSVLAQHAVLTTTTTTRTTAVDLAAVGVGSNPQTGVADAAHQQHVLVPRPMYGFVSAAEDPQQQHQQRMAMALHEIAGSNYAGPSSPQPRAALTLAQQQQQHQGGPLMQILANNARNLPHAMLPRSGGANDATALQNDQHQLELMQHFNAAGGTGAGAHQLLSVRHFQQQLLPDPGFSEPRQLKRKRDIALASELKTSDFGSPYQNRAVAVAGAIKTREERTYSSVHMLWSENEDEKLRKIVAEQGAKDWPKIATLLGSQGRTGKSCRQRWLNHLCVDVNNSPFTQFEDDEIIRIQGEIGNKWSAIAKALTTGRSDNAIKNRWHLYLKPERRAKRAEAKHAAEMRSADGTADLQRIELPPPVAGEVPSTIANPKVTNDTNLLMLPDAAVLGK